MPTAPNAPSDTPLRSATDREFLAIGAARVRAALALRAGDPTRDAVSILLPTIMEARRRIEKNTTITSAWPKLFHPIIRALQVKTPQRDTALALNRLATLVDYQNAQLMDLSERLRRKEAGIPAAPATSRAPRLLFDVTYTDLYDQKTGIQRVIRNLARELVLNPPPEVEVLLVKVSGWRLLRADAFAARLGLPPPATPAIPLEPGPNDTFVTLESGRELTEEYEVVMGEIRRHGGRVVGGIHDIIPITLPEVLPQNRAHFAEWLAILLHYSTDLLCISRAVADEVRTYVDTTAKLQVRKIPLGYFHNGVDTQELSPTTTGITSKRVKAIRAAAGTMIIMVGTIDPRKGHEVMLDALDILRAKGVDICLCVVGKARHDNPALISRLARPGVNKNKLHWYEDASDAELAECYRCADLLVFASRAEGFGLPLIEAARFDIPIVCSDIPVFREICEEHATYFPVGDAPALAETISRWINEKKAGRIVKSAGMRYLDWRQSAKMLGDTLYAGANAMGHVGAQPAERPDPARASTAAPAPFPCPVFVISLPRSTDRRDYMRRHLGELGIPFEFFDAVDGATLPADLGPLYDDETCRAARAGIPLKRGEIACALSHVALWKRIRSERIPFALVLEDDVIIRAEDFRGLIESTLRQAGPAEVILLSKQNRHLSANRVAPLIGPYSLRYVTMPTWLTWAYIVGEQAAARLESAALPVRFPIDAWCLPTGFKGLVPLRAVVPQSVEEQSRFPSVIDTIEVRHFEPPVNPHFNALIRYWHRILYTRLALPYHLRPASALRRISHKNATRNPAAQSSAKLPG